MNTVVLTTAGHIDHGKTSLLKALTGVDADRLPEEQRRGMTLDVGYAVMTLPDGSEVDFVDVPGHQDLSNNTIVGAGEADGFMLVVDAVEGIRAQTVEHLDVLRGLGLRYGVAAISKTDILDLSQRQRAIVDLTAEIASQFDVPPEIVSISSLTGEGLDRLSVAISNVAAQILSDPLAPAGRRSGPPLLPIDRVFVVKGRGTVVTGTLRGGRLAEGQTVSIEPDGFTGQIAELQRRGRRITCVEGSGRVAVRLRGVKHGRMQRGMVVTEPGVAWKAQDVLVVVPTGAVSLHATERVVVHAATDRVDGVVSRVWPSLGNQLTRLRLRRPTALTLASTLLLRRSSTPSKFFGARLVDASSGIRWRKLSDAMAAEIATRALEGPAGRFKALLQARGAVADTDLRTQGEICRFAPERWSGDARSCGALWLSPAFALELANLLLTHVQDHLAGTSAAEARRLLGKRLMSAARRPKAESAAAAQSIVNRCIEHGHVVRRGEWLFAASTIPVARAGDGAVERLLALLRVPTPPALSLALEMAGCSPVELTALERHGEIVRLDREIAYSSETYERLAQTVCELARRRAVTPGLLRDEIRATRKYAIALLEHLDAEGVLTRTPAGHVLTDLSDRGRATV